MVLQWADNRNNNYEIYSQLIKNDDNLVGTNERISNNTGTSLYPSIICNASTYCVAWVDDRTNDWDNYYSTINSGGSVVVAETTITNDNYETFPASPTYNGTNYTFVYQTNIDELPILLMDRIAAGTSGPTVNLVTLNRQTGNSVNPEVLYNSGSSEYVLFWQDDRSVADSWDIYANKYNASTGAKVWTNDVVIATGANNQIRPVVAKSASYFSVLWEENNDITLERMNTAGTKQGTLNISADAVNYSGLASICANDTGSEFGIAWVDDRNTHKDIYVARATEAGAFSATGGGNQYRLTDDTNTSTNPDITYGSSSYGVVWTDNREEEWDIYFNRFTSAGKVGTEVLVTTSELSSAIDNAYFPKIVWNGSNFFVIYISLGSSDNSIYSQRITASDAPEAAQLIYKGKIKPDISKVYYNSTDSEFITTWQEFSDDDNLNDIFYIKWKVETDGSITIVNNNAMSITSNPNTTSSNPSVAYNGTSYGFFWQDNKYGKYEIFMNF